MRGSNLIASLQVHDVCLLSIHFDVMGDSPHEEAQASLTVEASETDVARDDGAVVGTTIVTVSSNIVGAETEELPYMSLEATVEIITSSPDDGRALEDIGKSQRRVAIAAGYAFIRSKAMEFAGISPMRRLVLPEIDVEALFETQED